MDNISIICIDMYTCTYVRIHGINFNAFSFTKVVIIVSRGFVKVGNYPHITPFLLKLK